MGGLLSMLPNEMPEQLVEMIFACASTLEDIAAE